MSKPLAKRKFFDGVTPPMRLASLGFAVALVGATIALNINYGPQNYFSYVAFLLCAIGVSLGFIGVAWGWVSAFRRSRHRE